MRILVINENTDKHYKSAIIFIARRGNVIISAMAFFIRAPDSATLFKFSVRLSAQLKRSRRTKALRAGEEKLTKMARERRRRRTGKRRMKTAAGQTNICTFRVHEQEHDLDFDRVVTVTQFVVMLLVAVPFFFASITQTLSLLSFFAVSLF